MPIKTALLLTMLHVLNMRQLWQQRCDSEAKGLKHAYLSSTWGMSCRAALAKLRASIVWCSGCWLPLPTTRYSRY